jgi:alpha-amylase
LFKFNDKREKERLLKHGFRKFDIIISHVSIMISTKNTIRTLLKSVPLLMLALLLFTACKKEATRITPPPVVPANIDTTTTIQTKWWNDAVFYEVFVRSFYDANGDGNGDLKGLIEKLDYLNDGDPLTNTDLGITALWLMPVMQSPSYHGYDVTDYRTIESDYGTNDDFKALIAAAHARGIKVIIDYVMNHTSEQHPWFTQSAASAASPYRNWYRWSITNPGGTGPWGQTVWYNLNSAYYYALFWSGMPDLNYETPAVKTEMFDIARFWLQDMHVDGFRLDAVKYIYESGAQLEDVDATLQFFHDFRSYYKSIDANTLAVGEAWTSTDKVVKYVQNDRLDFCFEFDLESAIINAVNNIYPLGVTNKIAEVIAAYPALQYGTFLTNHDQDRVMSVFNGDVSKAKIASQLLLSLPGVPFVYYGEEIGTIGVKPDENIRTPLQWNSSANSGFTTGTPWRNPQADFGVKNIANEQLDPNSLWQTYRQMITIRNNEIALRRGFYISMTSNSGASLVFLRKYKSQGIIVASNVGSIAVTNLTVSLAAEIFPPGNYTLTDQLTGATRNLTVSDNGGFSNQSLGELPARSTAIYKMKKN